MKTSLALKCAGTLAAVAMLSGCIFAPVVPPRGILFTDQKAPLFPGAKPGTKVGQASAHNILFLVGWGDSGLGAALRDGGITEVRHTDYRALNYLLVYQRYTTIVYGE